MIKKTSKITQQKFNFFFFNYQIYNKVFNCLYLKSKSSQCSEHNLEKKRKKKLKLKKKTYMKSVYKIKELVLHFFRFKITNYIISLS